MKIIEFLQQLFSPLGFVWLVLIAAAVMSFMKRQRLMGAVSIMAALMLAIVGNIHFATRYLVDMESPYRQIDLSSPVSVNSITPADAVVVMNWAGPGSGESVLPVSYASGGERVILGAELTVRGKAKHLVLPDNHDDIRHETLTSADKSDFLIERFGLTDRQIVKVPAADDLYRQAMVVSRMAEIHNWKSVHVVTSALEMDRAVAVFEKLGIRAIPVACDFRSIADSEDIGAVSILPDSRAVDIFSSVMSEKMKIRRYRMRGWI
jgi:hypothetical protein